MHPLGRRPYGPSHRSAPSPPGPPRAHRSAAAPTLPRARQRQDPGPRPAPMHPAPTVRGVRAATPRPHRPPPAIDLGHLGTGTAAQTNPTDAQRTSSTATQGPGSGPAPATSPPPNTPTTQGGLLIAGTETSPGVGVFRHPSSLLGRTVVRTVVGTDVGFLRERRERNTVSQTTTSPLPAQPSTQRGLLPTGAGTSPGVDLFGTRFSPRSRNGSKNGVRNGPALNPPTTQGGLLRTGAGTGPGVGVFGPGTSGGGRIRSRIRSRF